MLGDVRGPATSCDPFAPAAVGRSERCSHEDAARGRNRSDRPRPKRFFFLGGMVFFGVSRFFGCFLRFFLRCS